MFCKPFHSIIFVNNETHPLNCTSLFQVPKTNVANTSLHEEDQEISILEDKFTSLVLCGLIGLQTKPERN